MKPTRRLHATNSGRSDGSCRRDAAIVVRRPAAPASAGRLFLGVPITPEARRVIREALNLDWMPGRPVPPENWHLTLVFLGDTADEAMARLSESLRLERLGPSFAVELGGLGAFPRASRASILWLGVSEGAGALAALNDAVGRAARRAGFPVEERRFTPHITLSRVMPPGDVRPFMSRAAGLRYPMEVDGVSLFRSHLGDGPARYEELERFELG